MCFGILKDEIIVGFSVEILKMLSNSPFFFNSAKRQIRLFINEKDLNKIELTFFKKLHILLEKI